MMVLVAVIVDAVAPMWGAFWTGFWEELGVVLTVISWGSRVAEFKILPSSCG
jgi:hypothetical protein